MLIEMLLTVLISSLTMPVLDFNMGHFANASSKTTSATSDEMQIDILETVRIDEDYTCNLSLTIQISDSPLGGYYRDALKDWSNISDPIEIPEDVPLDPPDPPQLYQDVNQLFFNSSQEYTPFREQILNAVRQEHEYSLGIYITNWTVHEWSGEFGEYGACLFHVVADAELLNVQSSDGVTTIAVGPQDLNASFSRVEYLLTKIAFIQEMLNSSIHETNQTWSYKSSWNTTLILPHPLTINSTQELYDTDPWIVDFGDGTIMNASVNPIPLLQSVVLMEKFSVTNNTISTTAEELLEQGLLCYKVFNMEVDDPISTYSESRCTGVMGGDWHTRWSLDLWEGEFEWNPAAYPGVTLNVYSRLNISGRVGWDFKWKWWGVELRELEAYISIEPILRVNLTVDGIASNVILGQELFRWRSPKHWFQLFGVPLYYEYLFTTTAVLDVYANVSMRINCAADATGRLTAGARWKRHDGWSKIFEANMSINRAISDPQYQNLIAEVTPSVEFELAIIFLSSAGPSVKFIPYATLDIDTGAAADFRWNITVGLNVTAGIKFDDWLADILGLDGWHWQIWNHVFWKYPVRIHDVAVTDIRTPMKAFVTEPVTIYVDILNQGNYPETDITVTLYWQNGGMPGPIGGEVIPLLPIGNLTTISITWNTTKDKTDLTNDTYTITAIASPSIDNKTDNNSDDNFIKLEIQNVTIVDLTHKCIKTCPITGECLAVGINVTVMNKGSVDVSTLLILVYYDETPISDIWCEYMHVVFDLEIGDSRKVNFIWNMRGTESEGYAIKAYVPPLPYEIDTTDNTYVTIPGDVDGDRDVDRYDYGHFALAYGTKRGDARWDERCDFDYTGWINRYDFGILAQNYGKSV